jgi:hypothetical protein
MAFILDANGGKIDCPIDATIYKQAFDANLSVPQFINKKFQAADPKRGTPYQQILASEGLVIGTDNIFGQRSSTIADILDGKSGFDAAANTRDNASPYGTASRSLFPSAIITAIESVLAKDRTTDLGIWSRMVKNKITVAGETFDQPVIDYSTPNGPENTRAQRIAQLAEPASMLRFTTSDRFRRIPTWSIGAEFSTQSLRSTTLDTVAMTMARYWEVEKDAHVYEQMSDLFAGDADLNTGAVSAVTTTSLDSTATGGVVTHKSWVKFLARNRKYRQIDFCIGDIDTYLKVEGRTGRPGSNNYDPTLARLDPQALVMNVPFGGNVEWFIVDAAADGGPVPANTVWAVDSRYAISEVTNSAAEYSASEKFALRRAEAFRMDWASIAYRTFGNTDLKPFDVLTIS